MSAVKRIQRIAENRSRRLFVIGNDNFLLFYVVRDAMLRQCVKVRFYKVPMYIFVKSGETIVAKKEIAGWRRLPCWQWKGKAWKR